MLGRNENIFADVKLQIGRSPVNNEMFRAANRVQNEIFATGDIERSFEIILEKDVEIYDFIKQECLVIITILPSWENGKITFRPNTKWAEYRDLTGAHPDSATIFGRRLYLSPIPISSDDKLEIWGYQTKVNVKMDSDVGPELDETFDDALMWGICTQFNSSYLEKYQFELGRQLNNLNLKKQSIEDPEWTW